MSKNVKLSFADEMDDEDDDEPLAPISKKMTQAPPPFYIHQQQLSEDRSMSYSGDYLQELKASQKLSAPKVAEVVVMPTPVTEEVILTGEEAEKAMEVAEEANEQSFQTASTTLGHTWEEAQILLEGKNAAKSLLKGNDKERIFLSAHQAAPEKSHQVQFDLANDQDMDWEEEVMQRGVISSKPVAEVIAEARIGSDAKRGSSHSSSNKKVKDDIDVSSSRSSGGYGRKSLSSNDVCIEDIIQNVRTALANVRENIEHNESRLSELEVQKTLLLGHHSNKSQFEELARKFNAFQESKIYLKQMVYMLRSKQEGLDALVRGVGEVLEEWVNKKIRAMKEWQEERILAVKQVGELESIGDYQAEYALLSPTPAPIALNPSPSVYSSVLKSFHPLPPATLALLHEGKYEEAVCFPGQERLFGAHIGSILLLRMLTPTSTSTPPLSFCPPLSDMLARFEELVGDVADDMLSTASLFQNLIVLYDSIGREKFEEAHTHLSLLQLLVPLLTLSLTVDVTSTVISATPALPSASSVLGGLLSFIERVGGNKADSKGGDGWGAEVIGEIFLNPMLPFFKHLLCALDLFNREACESYVLNVKEHMKFLPEDDDTQDDERDGDDKKTYKCIFIARWSEYFLSIVTRFSSSMCIPACSTSFSSEELTGGSVEGEGRWKGMGKAVMVHQLMLLTTFWSHVYVFRDLMDERTIENLVTIVRKAMLEKALAALVAGLVSNDQQSQQTTLQFLSTVIMWMELKASTLAKASMLQDKAEKVHQALQLQTHDKIERCAAAVKALVSHLQSPRV